MSESRTNSSPINLYKEKFQEYVSALSKEDKAILNGFFNPGMSSNDHTIENHERLFKMLEELGLYDPSCEKRKQTDAERIEMYKQFGLDVDVPTGRSGFSQSMMRAVHDGVPYCIDDNGDYFNDADERSLKREIAHREMMIERHHLMIKDVYQFCTTLDRGDIWVLCGGGTQLQAFFGCRNGYLAILNLSLETDRASKPEDLEKMQRKTRTLQPNFEHNEPLFKGMKIPGVKVKNYPRPKMEP